MPAKIVSGRGCLCANKDAFKEFGRRCLVITGAGSAKKSGALRDVENVLKDDGIDYILYDKVTPNPLLSTCFAAGSAARKFRADFIVGIGGGSALDAAKAAAVFAGNPSFTSDDIYGGKISKALPSVLVGTTAGTGSEVTGTAVLTIDEKNIKKSVNSKYCYAALAFCDPVYTGTCPYNLTVSAALDALCHAVESFYSVRAGSVSRTAALEAVKLLWPNLVWLLEHPDVLPDYAEREQLYYGSLWAGITLNHAGTGFPHPAGYPLSTELGIPHGKACAVFLPDYVRHVAPAAPELTLRLFGALGCGVEAFCEKVTKLAAIRGVRLTADKCAEYAKSLEGRHNLTNCIAPSTVEEIQAIYEKLFL